MKFTTISCMLIVMINSSADQTYSLESVRGHVLAFPHPGHSNALAMLRMCEEINKHYRYRVTMVVAEPYATMISKRKTSTEIIISNGLGKIDYEEIFYAQARAVFTKVDSSLSHIPLTNQICDRLLEDKHLISNLSRQKFDIAIIDSTSPMSCTSALMYNLSIPFMRYGRYVRFVEMRTIAHPFAYPCPPFGTFTDSTTFMERFATVWCYMMYHFRTRDIPAFDVVEKFAPEKPHLTNSEFQAQTQLYLLDFDVLMDYHLTPHPNMVFVGGLVTRPARELKGEVRNFMDSAVNGAIIVSFGSFIKYFPEDMLTKLSNMFVNFTEYKFLVQNGKSTKTIDNVMYMSWVPQNDALGHPNTKAFITHCGNAAQFEALYHGVPMLGLPIMFDQPYNARRMRSKGYGLYLDAIDFSEEDLITSMTDILTNQKYRQKIKSSSNIFKRRPETPDKRVAYWVDHVIKYGGHYLRSPVAEIPYYQFLCLDIALCFLSGGIVLVLALVYMCTRLQYFVSRTKVKQD